MIKFSHDGQMSNPPREGSSVFKSSITEKFEFSFGKVDSQMTRQSEISSHRKISVIIEEIDQEQEKIGQV